MMLFRMLLRREQAAPPKERSDPAEVARVSHQLEQKEREIRHLELLQEAIQRRGHSR